MLSTEPESTAKCYLQLSESGLHYSYHIPTGSLSIFDMATIVRLRKYPGQVEILYGKNKESPHNHTCPNVTIRVSAVPGANPTLQLARVVPNWSPKGGMVLGSPAGSQAGLGMDK